MKGLLSGHCTALISQLLVLSRIRQGVLLSLGYLLISRLAPRLRDVIVEQVGVETGVDPGCGLAINSMHLRHNALREHFIELL